MFYLYAFVGLVMLWHIVDSLGVIFLLVFLVSGLLSITSYIITTVNCNASKVFLRKSSRLTKISFLTMIVLCIIFEVLSLVKSGVVGKLHTDVLGFYPDSEWVSDDGNISILMGSAQQYESKDLDGKYTYEGTYIIVNGQNTVEYELYAIRYYTMGAYFPCFDDSKIDDPEMTISIYLLDGDTFYGRICENDEQWLGKIVKFHRVYN